MLALVSCKPTAIAPPCADCAAGASDVALQDADLASAGAMDVTTAPDFADASQPCEQPCSSNAVCTPAGNCNCNPGFAGDGLVCKSHLVSLKTIPSGPVALSADATSFVACGGSAACMVGAKRTFEMVGVDSRLELNHDSFGIKNETEIGVRLHTESRLNQTVSSFTDENARNGALTGNQDSHANSVAFYGQNRFILNDRFAVTPGLRVESYTQKDVNLLNGVGGKASNTEFVPGIGATWQVSPQAQVFAGAHRGFSPAMMAASIVGGVDQRLDAERSTNVEIGVRGTVDRVRYEATAFQMDFANQIVNASASANVTQSNAGKTLHQGLEGLLGIDLGAGWSAETNMTYLPVAKYNSDRLGSSATVNGNRLPYAPELVANLALNYQTGALTTRLSATHVSSQFVDAANTVTESDDGRKGVIPAYTTVNLNARYALSKQTSLFATLRNLTDKKYITSRNPDGIFPGAERNLQVGISHKF